jgi:hypothetical protein
MVFRGLLGTSLPLAMLGAALLLAMVPAAAQAVSVSVTGPQELIYDYSTMACDTVDPPDIPARAFRDSLGRVQVTMGQPFNRRMIGPDFDHLTHDCTVTLGSDASPVPWDFNYAEWLGGTWAEPTGEVHGLIHSEWHGRSVPGWCPSNVFIRCRYNTVTAAKSTNNGDTFTHAAPPAHLVAAMPYPYYPDTGRIGIFSPGNIVEKDGWYYATLMVSQQFKRQQAGTCLMRTQDLDDPRSWRAWDGTGFGTRFINPYLESAEPVSRHVCEPVSFDEIGTMARSLVFDTDLGKWIIVGTAAKYDAGRGEDVWGFYYSLSDDMIHWSERQLLMEVETGGTYMCGDQNPRAYPSLIDHSSPRRNFDQIDNSTYLYFTQHNYVACAQTNDRDLVRVPIQFTP